MSTPRRCSCLSPPYFKDGRLLALATATQVGRTCPNNYTRQGNRTFLPLIWGLLAHIEADGGGTQAPLIRVDEALALAAETGERWTDSFLHQIRGEILLRGDAANTGPAEDALLNAIAIAQQQKAKSFELRATLALAKVYQSNG